MKQHSFCRALLNKLLLSSVSLGLRQPNGELYIPAGRVFWCLLPQDCGLLQSDGDALITISSQNTIQCTNLLISNCCLVIQCVICCGWTQIAFDG